MIEAVCRAFSIYRRSRAHEYSSVLPIVFGTLLLAGPRARLSRGGQRRAARMPECLPRTPAHYGETSPPDARVPDPCHGENAIVGVWCRAMSCHVQYNSSILIVGLDSRWDPVRPSVLLFCLFVFCLFFVFACAKRKTVIVHIHTNARVLGDQICARDVVDGKSRFGMV